MGAWGYGPYGNDAAYDWLSRLVPEVRKALKRKARPDEALTAAAFLTDYLGKHIAVAPEAQLAIGRLTQIRDDEKWLGGWSEPEKKRRQIDAQIRKLEKLWEDWEA